MDTDVINEPHETAGAIMSSCELFVHAKPTKPLSEYSFTRLLLCFSHCHNSWSKMGTEATFGGAVAFMIWIKQPAMKTTTSIDISVRNYVVHA